MVQFPSAPSPRTGHAQTVHLAPLACDNGSRPSVEGAVEQLGLSVIVSSLCGTELFRSGAARRLLELEPLPAPVVSEVERLSRCVRAVDGAQAAPCAAKPSATPVTRMVSTGGREYVLRSALLAAGLFDGDASVVTAIQCSTPELPDAARLRVRFGLTAREAEVALLLAHGASNKSIAARLRISMSTVRTHSERLFTKLCVHSRKALALHLFAFANHPGS